jgi:glycosyltransferase involved in cell wall biosynthesis
VTEKTSILHICDKFGVAGSTIHGVSRLFLWWFPLYDRDRFDVHLLGLRPPDPAGRHLEKLGIPIIYLNKSKFSPATLPALLGVIRRLKPDLLHLHGYGAGTFGRIAARIAGLPAVVHEHFVDPHIPLYQQVAEAMLKSLATQTVAVSRSVKEFCVAKRRIDPDRISVIYNGVPLDQFVPLAPEAAAAHRRALGVPEGTKIVGFVGRLHEQKGVEFLVKAVPKVLEAHPNTRFVIVGDGALWDELHAMAGELGIAENVLFTGFREDVRAILSTFDIIVIPSLYEGTPLTVFEAMALCNPIVATPVDGLGEVLADQRTALLIPPRDAAAVADAVSRLLADPGLCRKLSENCREERHRFDISATVQQMQDLYDRILHRDHRN